MKTKNDDEAGNTLSPKTSRLVFFQELAKRVHPSGTIAHVPGTFLSDLKRFLNFSDEEIAALWKVSRPLIVRKRKTAEEDPAPERTGTGGSKAAQGDMTLEDFMTTDLSPEEELQFLKNYGKQTLSALPEGSPARFQLFKFLVERSERRVEAETAEGKQLIVTLLGELKQVYNESYDLIKKETDRAIRAAIERFIDEAASSPATDIQTIKSTILGQIEPPDPWDLVSSLFKTKPHIMERITDYERRLEDKPPSLVGGGVVRDESSEKGGAQYRQREREEERKRIARGN